MIGAASLAIAATVIAAVISTGEPPPADPAGQAGQILLNEALIEAAWLEHGLTAQDLAGLRPAKPISDQTPTSPTSPTSPIDAGDPHEPRDLCAAVLSRLPARNIVYPSEQYFYFQLEQGGVRYAGNLRFTDAAEGALHIGYFRLDDPRGDVWHEKLSSKDRLNVTNRGGGVFTVNDEIHGVERTFVLARRWLEIPGELPVRPHEQAVTGLLDESGIALVLIFNTRSNSFYYALNPGMPLADSLRPIGGEGRLLLGDRTGFVFFEDGELGRHVLIGVARDEVMANSYFDGPFDQVPPRLEIGDRLRRAYPYVKMRGDINDHGVFLTLDDQRVAISPYRAYPSVGEVVHWAERILDDRNSAETTTLRLTYEDKQDFHIRLRVGAAAHHRRTPLWPQGHLGQVSLTWPAEHEGDASRGWKPNRVGGG